MGRYAHVAFLGAAWLFAHVAALVSATSARFGTGAAMIPVILLAFFGASLAHFSALFAGSCTIVACFNTALHGVVIHKRTLSSREIVKIQEIFGIAWNRHHARMNAHE